MGRMQFSLRILLAAVAVVGIGAALWTAQPSWQVGILQTSFVLALPACVTVGAMQWSGHCRAFCVGLSFATTIPAVIFLLRVTNESAVLIVDSAVAGIPLETSGEEMQLLRGLSLSSSLFKLAAGQWAFAPVVGLLCVFTHWLLVRPASAERKD